MTQKKIVLLGMTGVGKTSLVRRFVESLFGDAYLTTIGVKVDKKQVRVGDQDVQLMIWDIAGAEERFSVPVSYVRGAAGFLVVADGTRPETLEGAIDLVAELRPGLADARGVLVLNKADLSEQWKLEEPFGGREGWTGPVVRASAKTGDGVESAFLQLAESLLA